jgi:hypothetical protein
VALALARRIASGEKAARARAAAAEAPVDALASDALPLGAISRVRGHDARGGAACLPSVRAPLKSFPKADRARKFRLHVYYRSYTVSYV